MIGRRLQWLGIALICCLTLTMIWSHDGFTGPGIRRLIARVLAGGGTSSCPRVIVPAAQTAKMKPVPHLKPTVYVPSSETDLVIELYLAMLHYRLLRHTCPTRARDVTGFEYCAGLAVDIGLNQGWYSLLFGVMGCDVVGLDPVVLVNRDVWKLNGVDSHITVHNRVLHSLPSNTGMKVDVVSHQFMPVTGSEMILGRSIRLADVVPRNRSIQMIKIDIEGGEIDAFASMQQFLEQNRPAKIYNFVVEFTPKWWERFGVFDIAEGITVMEKFIDRYEYDVYVVHWGMRARREMGPGNMHFVSPTIDWDGDRLRHIQRVRRSVFRKYVGSLTGQTDFWFHLRTHAGGYALVGTGLDLLEDVYCDARGWGYAEDTRCWGQHPPGSPEADSDPNPSLPIDSI